MKVVTAFQLAFLSLLGKIIKVASCSGAVAEKVRQAGRKSPCQWQSWKLHANQAKKDTNKECTKRIIEQCRWMISGIGIGVGSRIMGGIAMLQKMEQTEGMYLGVDTINQLLVVIAAFAVAALILPWSKDN